MPPETQPIPWQRYFRFAVTGGTAFVIDAGLYFGLTRFGHLPYLVSRAISLGVAMIWNFLINRNWTFQAQAGNVGRQAGRFLIVMISTSLLSLLLMRVGVSTFGLNDLLVLVLVSVLIMGVNYTLHQLWSYKD